MSIPKKGRVDGYLADAASDVDLLDVGQGRCFPWEGPPLVSWKRWAISITVAMIAVTPCFNALPFGTAGRNKIWVRRVGDGTRTTVEQTLICWFPHDRGFRLGTASFQLASVDCVGSYQSTRVPHRVPPPTLRIGVIWARLVLSALGARVHGGHGRHCSGDGRDDDHPWHTRNNQMSVSPAHP